ncbi:MAG: diguanylate cyclase [Deltaproteobacteria bacterium]|nr:diguanylate cyclase [Deltaproteobacteria bacterium]
MDEICHKQSVLIVDDEPGNAKILVELLRPSYTVRVAVDGAKALQVARSDIPPDLILLDVVMPGMDGYEVCQELKADPRTQDIPIIFITAKDSEQDQIKGFNIGAVDYITKPFSPVVVEARVKTHVELKIKSELLKKLSLRDGLTGIANRRRFDEYLTYVWDFSKRESLPLSLILIDIDHFKLFNDNYGHLAGDACLVQVAQTLDNSIKRKTDLAARYGGEEFGCILPHTNSDGALALANNMSDNLRLLSIPHVHSGTCSWLTISQGVATVVPTRDTRPDTLIKVADEALYRAKSEGRNRVVCLALDICKT